MLTVLLHLPDPELAAAGLSPGGPGLARLAWTKAREVFPRATFHAVQGGPGIGPREVLAAWAKDAAAPAEDSAALAHKGALVIVSAAFPLWPAEGVRRVWDAARGPDGRVRATSTAAPVADHPYLLYRDQAGVGPRPYLDGGEVRRGHRQDYPELVEACAATTVLCAADAGRWDELLAAGKVRGILMEARYALAVRDAASLAWARQKAGERRAKARTA